MIVPVGKLIFQVRLLLALTYTSLPLNQTALGNYTIETAVRKSYPSLSDSVQNFVYYDSVYFAENK